MIISIKAKYHQNVISVKDRASSQLIVERHLICNEGVISVWPECYFLEGIQIILALAGVSSQVLSECDSSYGR